MLFWLPPLVFFLTYIATVALERWLRVRGHMVPDMHKRGRPGVPMPGGPAIMLGLIAFLLPTFWITGDARALGVLLLTFVGFMIGLYDDIKKLGGVQKVFLLQFLD